MWIRIANWLESKLTPAEQSGNVLDALASSDAAGDHLWEDNWDDDDVEDDFIKQLRLVSLVVDSL